MRLTWFGGSTFRLYLGGRIIVTDPDMAPEGVDRAELAAAADHVVDLRDGIADFPLVDPATWRPTRRGRLIEDAGETIVELLSTGGEALVVDEPDEGPVVIAPATLSDWGRFADGAVVAIYGSGQAVADGARALLGHARPKLVAMAGDVGEADMAAVAAVAGQTPVQALETGLALEA